MEIPSGKVIELSKSVKFFIRSVGTGDSYCIIEMDKQVFVNTNDAILLSQDLTQLEKDIKQFSQVDLLTTQFGLAGKVGNWNDEDLRRSESKEVRELVLRQIEVVAPRYFIPSASMKVFSRSDNFYMNLGQSSLRSLYEMINDNSSTVPVFLDSFEQFDFEAIPNPDPMITKFDSILANSSKTPLNPKIDPPADIQTIQSAIEEWWKRQRTSHSSLGLFSLRFLPGGFRLRNLNARISDLNQCVSIISPLLSRSKNNRSSRSLQVEVTSTALVHSLRDDFGLMSLIISARYQGSIKAQKVLRTLAWVGSQRAAGKKIGLISLVKTTTRGISFIFRTRQAL
jgi:hypothetical protein